MTDEQKAILEQILAAVSNIDYRVALHLLEEAKFHLDQQHKQDIASQG